MINIKSDKPVDNFRPLNPIRGFCPLTFSSLKELKDSIHQAGTVESVSVDDPEFDETLRELIDYWARNFDLCYYLALRIPNTPNVLTYFVMTVNAKNPGTKNEQLTARSMMFSMIGSIITKDEMKLLSETFVLYPKPEVVVEEISEPEVRVVPGYDPEELDDIQPPAYIESLADLSKY